MNLSPNTKNITAARLFMSKVLLFLLLVLMGGAHSHAAKYAPAELTFERTPERIARGKYLVESVARCFDCHSEKDAKGKVVPGTEGGGRVISVEESRLPRPYFLVCPNTTPDYQTGAGSWSRRHQLPKRHLPSEPLTNWRPDVQPPPLPSGAAARRGEYLVHIADCTGCHTTADPQNHPIAGMLFGGGRVFVRPWGTAATPNLTQDASGISYYDEAQFIRTIRTGHVGARALNPTMPYLFFRNMTDDDLKAIFAYLRTLPPVQHRVDNSEPPTFCPKCHNRHGYGDRN